ncbi:TIGR01666 family membrane protein [Snodgrassella sp. B3882]|uniref:YccS family putative transporter n=1 Tax=Snodgrassella sp. B3882 TaxID=2818037 RepID=UPI00226A5414|nr:YccS family putative transporter [Snodgrassella sp. B3882]MCX8745488.1 TIGR01666 family membrane protein [Snodgrassella sp. B3882]
MRLFPVRTGYLTNLPMLISMVLAALWVWYTHNTHESTALFLGIIAGGLVDLDDGFTGRLRNLFFTLIYFALAATAVQLTYGRAWEFSLLMVCAAFGLTMVGAVDMRYRTIAFGTLLVMLYTVLTYAPQLPWYTNPLMLICGTSLFSLCTLVLHVLFPDRPVQDNLANAYAMLSEYMLIKARFFDPDEADLLPEQEFKLAMQNTAVINGFNQCRTALFYRLRRQQRYRRTGVLLQYYLTAQNIHERISSRHVDYAAMSQKLVHSDLIFRIQRLIVLQAEACQQMSCCLHEDRPFVFDAKLTRAGEGLQRSAGLYGDEYGADDDTPGWRQLIANILAINELLQLLAQVKSDAISQPAAENTIIGMDVNRLRDVLPALKMHFTLQSTVLRHATRLAILTGLICLMVEGLHLKLGYWILLTGIIVCQPNYTATTTRLKQRIIGTLLGVLVGSVMPFFVPTLAGKLVIVVVSTVLFFVFRFRRYSFSTFFITVQVLVGFAIIGIDTQAMMLPRFVDTILGAVLAWMAVSYLWPDWRYLTLGRIASRALNSDAVYLQQVAQQLLNGQKDDVVYRAARRDAYELAATLSNTVADMSMEPQHYGQRVDEGKTLLQLNYVLVSCISALGALRSQVDRLRAQLPDTAIEQWSKLAANIAFLMSEPMDLEKFEQSWMEIQSNLERGMQENSTEVVEQVLWRQLQRIHKQLPLYRYELYPAQRDASNS